MARRISAWTSNSLVTVMLVVIALGFGRQVLHWWHAEEPPRPSMTSDPLGDRTAPHVLEFGDQAWSIRRQEFSGPREGLTAALQDACRAAIVDSLPRGETAGADEHELLKRLAAEKPMAEERGRWRLYQWGAGHPLLIGTRVVPALAKGVGSGEPSPLQTQGRATRRSVEVAIAPNAGTNLDESTYRVVTWGVAVPAAAGAWTLYLFQSGGAAGGAGQGGDKIPLPPDGHRLLAIHAAAGEAITAFSADDCPAARKFYAGWFADHGWTATHAWQQIAAGWHAGFEKRASESGQAVDIRLGIDSQGRWSGLILESQLERGKP